MFHKAKLWFSIIIAFLFGKRVPSAQSEEKQPYRLNLQFFAEGGDESGNEAGLDEEDDDLAGDNDEDEGPGDDEPNLEQMLKDNPKLKRQFNQLFKNKFDKRLKGIDLKKAKELLAKESKKPDDKARDETDMDEEVEKTAKLQLKIDRKAKRLAVKEYAADHGHNPKLIARLVDLDSLELNEDGEVDPDDLEEAFEAIAEEFPELFAPDEEDEDADGPRRSAKKPVATYRPGSRQKGNKQPKTGGYEAGKARALARHKKEEK